MEKELVDKLYGIIQEVSRKRAMGVFGALGSGSAEIAKDSFKIGYKYAIDDFLAYISTEDLVRRLNEIKNE